uniref:Uncharacterized protein n=1 Tax=Ciona savignyi TaxID=51511 RepID=H2ZHP3_CIOSA
TDDFYFSWDCWCCCSLWKARRLLLQDDEDGLGGDAGEGDGEEEHADGGLSASVIQPETNNQWNLISQKKLKKSNRMIFLMKKSWHKCWNNFLRRS